MSLVKRAGSILPVASFCLIVLLFVLPTNPVEASDHLDTPTVIADPAADIGDIYAWTSSDGRRLNLVMTIVGKRFSDRLQYVFHIDSGNRFGKTSASTSILCQFDSANAAECWAGNADYIRGDASNPAGLSGEKKRFQLFAGLRDDPFFNNVKGTRAAFNEAVTALKEKATVDASGCANFDEATSQAIFDQWRHTEGGPPKNFLDAWDTAALVISVDLSLVNSGGDELAVWGGTYKMAPEKSSSHERPTLGESIDRMGRALVANMLVGSLDSSEVMTARKETYNHSAPSEWSQFSADIQHTLGFYDGYDRTCGNQWLADRKSQPSARYQALAKLLADDRLWINSKSSVCTQYLAVELSDLSNGSSITKDCGGRTPNYNADAVFRSLLVRGTTDGTDDGLERDDGVHSTSEFPFLASPHTFNNEAHGSSHFGNTQNTKHADAARTTTTSSIAIANLDHLIAQRRDDVQVVELLLARSRFLGDYEALDRAASITENQIKNGSELLQRARVHSALHRFTDGLADLSTAEHSGVKGDEIAALRASILVATGHADEVLPKLEFNVSRSPTLTSRISLANAYAAVGRFADADHLYADAIADLDTTSPFPYAWIYFERGLMWSERAGNPSRGESMYARALTYLPEFAAANIHLAELEVARGALTSATARLEKVVASTAEPEALSLLGGLYIRTGDPTNGRKLIESARQSYDSLLRRHPLAFADHAAKFFLGSGNDNERAWDLAQQNLANRETLASFGLAIKAAEATGRRSEMNDLIAKAHAKFGSAENIHGTFKLSNF